MDVANQITPFIWHDHDDGSASVTLNTNEKYKKRLFMTRRKEGFVGSGDDWESLAQVVLREITPALQQSIHFDPEHGMFCAYSSDIDALKHFIITFKETCENDDLITDIFSRAEPQEPFSKEDITKVIEMLMNMGSGQKD